MTSAIKTSVMIHLIVVQYMKHRM